MGESHRPFLTWVGEMPIFFFKSAEVINVGKVSEISGLAHVDQSARVIAAYNGQSGGIRNAVNYTFLKNVDGINILNR